MLVAVVLVLIFSWNTAVDVEVVGRVSGVSLHCVDSGVVKSGLAVAVVTAVSGLTATQYHSCDTNGDT